MPLRKPKYCEACGAPMRHVCDEWFDASTGERRAGERRYEIECSANPKHEHLYWMLLPLGWQNAGWALGL